MTCGVVPYGYALLNRRAPHHTHTHTEGYTQMGTDTDTRRPDMAHVLAELAEQHGSITPRLLVDEARDPDSPLHAHFLWDDTAAAEKWRIVQARKLIARYRVTIVASPDTVVTVRRFTSVPIHGTTDREYVPTAQALENPRTHDVVLREATRAIAALRRKYQHLIDFDAVLRAAIEKTT